MKRPNSSPAENSLLVCDICDQMYNLSDKSPTMVNCCMETLCRPCWTSGFTENGSFKCPFKCKGETKENPQQPTLSRGVFKIVQKGMPLKVQCSDHQGGQISLFDTREKRFKC